MFWKDDEEEDKNAMQNLHIGSSLQSLYEELGEKEDDLLSKKKVSQDNEFPSSNEDGSEKRFEKRVDGFKEADEPLYKHHVWWLVHNCIAHPLIGLLPCKETFDFHDWTADKINGK